MQWIDHPIDAVAKLYHRKEDRPRNVLALKKLTKICLHTIRPPATKTQQLQYNRRKSNRNI